MTTLRLQGCRAGQRRWRRQALRRRTTLRVRTVANRPPHFPNSPVAAPVSSNLPLSSPLTLRIGDFVVGHDGDPQLLGHPEIRY